MYNDAKKMSEEFLLSTWNELKNDLYDGKVKYNDLGRLLSYTFLQQFDDMFKFMHEDNSINLANINKLYRGVKQWKDNKNEYYKQDRFIPKKEYASLNRFNPPEEVFIYLGVDLENGKDNTNSLSNVELGCLKEIRAENGEKASLCEFKVKESALNKKVIDLTIGDQYSYEELIREINQILILGELSRNLNRKYGNQISDMREYAKNSIKNKQGLNYKISKVMMKIYNKMISDKIFLPIGDGNRECEYIPFHAFANYFKNQGYAGIIYKSTVSPGSKNLVLFNVQDVEPIGEINRIDVEY
ncbi:MAG: RES family NAD+ phosphorylase [Paeniclostridium sordellii]|nr:RES family NAD+ phosphorylase [Paeniclostridium sordellii]